MQKDMTYLDILAELEKGATDGPWGKYDAVIEGTDERQMFIQPTWAEEEFSDIVCRDMALSNAHLIAFLRNTAEEVRAVVEALDCALARLNKDDPEALKVWERGHTVRDALDAKAREVSGR